jgi:hypothetical protein
MAKSNLSTILVLTFLFFAFLVPAQQKEKTMVPFPIDWEELASGEINLSFLLEKPAGKNGFIKIEEGHFVTPGGKRIRVWGVNLTGGACFPEKPEASKVATFLAAMGINAVRFHFLDSNWGADKSLFSSDTKNTRALNSEQLDKLDYFVSELKKQGIYSNFNLNVGRTYREGDDVPFYEYLGMAKAATLFDDRLIELQKEYAFQLLTHKNNYTGNEYRNEPALAFVEIVNENSLVEAWFDSRLLGEHNSTKTSTWIDIPEYYGKKLTEKFNHWLEQHLSENEMKILREELKLTAGEIVPRLHPKEFKTASELRFHAEARFIMETESAFYSGMYNYLKETVKVNQPVAANSDHNHWKSGYALLSSTSKLDFVDGHVYWQHPSYFTDPKTGENTFSIENTPMVNDPRMSTVAKLSRSAVAGKPYTISETNHPYPNEFACEGIPVLAAYALLQDWDGIYFYTLEHDDPLLWKTKKPNYFDILHDPAKIANLVAGALMFHRGDVQAAKTTVLRNYTEKDLIEGIRKDLASKPFFTPGFPPETPLVYKTRIQSFDGGENRFPEIQGTSPILSETRELTWYHENKTGLVTVNTSNTQALIGYSEKMKSTETQNLKADLKNPFAAVFLTSLDGKKIESSQKMLLTVTATSVLSGAKWNESRTSLTEWGHQPFVIEPVTGEIILQGIKNAKNLHIYPLDSSGKILGDGQKAVFKNNNLIFTLGKTSTVWYLIEQK